MLVCQHYVYTVTRIDLEGEACANVSPSTKWGVRGEVRMA